MIFGMMAVDNSSKRPEFSRTPLKSNNYNYYYYFDPKKLRFGFFYVYIKIYMYIVTEEQCCIDIDS